VLRRLARRALDRGLAPPAALTGTWFGCRAVLAPTVSVTSVATDPFAVPDRQPEVAGGADGVVGGGWFGYLGYGLTDPSPHHRLLPTAAWGWADHVLRYDHSGAWWFEALVPTGAPDPLDLATELADLLRAVPLPPTGWPPTELAPPSPAAHQKAVRACVEAIAAGEIFQANICSRFQAGFDGDPVALFATGIDRLAPKRAAFLTGDWGALVSFSPELFLSRHGNRVRSTPIKGTLPRRGPADAGNAERLRASVKDVAENVMIVDLVRNDLGRVAETGSVAVPELLAVHPAPGVWHLASTVEARLPAALGTAELLAATFPPGSVTGAPKLRALEIIAGLEDQPREVYCGAIGLASPVAGLELNVAIRTIEISGDRLWLGAGGGITADSDPEAEWQECLHKIAPLAAVLRND
jgi:para-aminobenzoate synthetase component 1